MIGAMKCVASPSVLTKRALLVLGVVGLAAFAPAPAMAGRPTIFELQEHLRQLPQKQREREAAQQMPVPVLDVEGAPREAPKRRR